jgi:hypothetical protein
VPFNPYHLTLKLAGFSSYVQDVDVRSRVPVSLAITLQVATAQTSVTVETAGDLVENDSTSHTDLPLESERAPLADCLLAQNLALKFLLK